MTIRIPNDNILDRILRLLGKERQVIMPEGAGKIYEKFGPSVQIKGRKESFFTALFRKTEKQNMEN
jgi:hypothetical protein